MPQPGSGKQALETHHQKQSALCKPEDNSIFGLQRATIIEIVIYAQSGAMYTVQSQLTGIARTIAGVMSAVGNIFTFVLHALSANRVRA